jgi:hypothetical protein
METLIHEDVIKERQPMETITNEDVIKKRQRLMKSQRNLHNNN